MARLAKFSPEQIVAVTARLAARDGPAQATMARIAGELGAPTGSIYHRFASRDLLLGEVWLGAAESFQQAFGAALEGPDPWAAGLAAALLVPSRVREQPDEARILILHRRDDFLAGGWPTAIAARAAALKQRADGGLRNYCRRLLGRADAASLRAVRYAVVDLPLAAVAPHLRAGEALPAGLDALIHAACTAVLTAAGASPSKSSTRRKP
jgi:AcrR family transcriptional regulator